MLNFICTLHAGSPGGQITLFRCIHKRFIDFSARNKGPSRPSLQFCLGVSFLCFKRAAQQFQIFGNLRIVLLEFFDAFHTVHDRRVVAPAKATTNFR